MTQLDTHFFRHEYARLVAMLVRRVGVQHVEAVEDAVQSALERAVETWSRTSPPDNPSAWLHRVAHNQLLDELRRSTRRSRLALQMLEEPALQTTSEPDVVLDGELPDDMLRMLFACCDDALAVDAQLVLALRFLCGFDVSEIAERLFLSVPSVYKRLTRARHRLRDSGFELRDLSAAQRSRRLPAVQTVLYVLFTEGHLSSHPDAAIRRELCDEAIRLTELLAQHPGSSTPETFALLALMHLHAARMPARQDDSGWLLLLEEQNRTHWDQRHIAAGLRWLARSAHGGVFSRFHAEAGIAAEHCLAPSFAATRWDRIVEGYELLEQLTPSMLHTLNRAVALAEWKGPSAGLEILEALAPPSWLVSSYMWAAVLADLHRRAGHRERAAHYRSAALAAAPSAAVKKALERRLGT